ncbi:hypothetical protein ABFV99_14020 [Cytobacillus horneckiae]|uniref:hypothetical protein n=1 Tax=Cytobacillus horneckiae TaxID=549687 RepID=UPI0034CF9F4A
MINTIIQEVIISPSKGFFESDEKLLQLTEEIGEPLFSIEWRTNTRILDYVKASKNKIVEGKEAKTFISIATVRTAIPWFIKVDCGAESIQYLDYFYVDTNLNYIEFWESDD